MSSDKKVFLVIGDPIEQSLSPLMHNAAFKFLSFNDDYIFLSQKVTSDELGDAIKACKETNINGIACTIPHKISVIKYLDDLDSQARTIGSVNSIVNENGKLIGYNTDVQGAIQPLEFLTSIENKKVAVLGAGGAARGVVFGLVEKKAKVTIFNKTLNRAFNLANEFSCNAQELSNISKVESFDIIINCTTVGMNNDESLVPKQFISSNQIIFDIIYNPYETKLIKDGIDKGAKVIRGVEMFLQQGFEQFKLFTKLNPPEEIMRDMVIDYLKNKSR